jgi:hypothetical protein
MPVRSCRSLSDRASFELHRVTAPSSKAYVPWFLALAWIAFGCGGTGNPAPVDAGAGIDSGTTPMVDAGNGNDAGSVQIDAGHGDIDAGAIDAGTTTPDAGEGAPCTETPWGTVPHGFSGTAYLNRVATRGTSCTGTLQVRTCTNGTMSGTYIQTMCTQYPCEYMGVRFADGTAGFTSSAAPAQFYQCGIDGSWSGPNNGNPAVVSTPCLFGNYYIEHGTCGYSTGDSRTYRCVSGTANPDTSCPVGP